MQMKHQHKNALAFLLILALAGTSLIGCSNEKTERQSAALMSLEKAVSFYETKNSVDHWEALVALCAANQADGIGIGWDFITLPKTPTVTDEVSSYTGAILSDTIKGENDPRTSAKTLAALQNSESGAFDPNTVQQHIWAMIALNVALSRDGYDYDKAVSHLLSYQAEDGGFSVSPGAKTGEVTLTGLACIALAPYYAEHKKSDEIKSILAFFEETQTTSGGFTLDGQENPNTISAAIWGLSAFSKKLPTTEEGLSPLDALLAYQNEDGSFRAQKDGEHRFDSQATRRATIALCDIVNGMNTYLLLAQDAQNYRIEHISGPAISFSIDYPNDSNLDGSAMEDVLGTFTVEPDSSPKDALILYGKITETPILQKFGEIKSIGNIPNKKGEPAGTWQYTHKLATGEILTSTDSAVDLTPAAVTLSENDALSWYFVPAPTPVTNGAVVQ